MPGASSPEHLSPIHLGGKGPELVKCDEWPNTPQRLWEEAAKRIVSSKPGGQGWQLDPHHQCF